MHSFEAKTHVSAFVRRGVVATLIVAGTSLPSVAVAVPQEAAGGLDPFASFSLFSFALGCSSGAVAGGLVAAIVGAQSKSRLEERLREASNATMRAEATAQQLYVRLEEMSKFYEGAAVAPPFEQDLSSNVYQPSVDEVFADEYDEEFLPIDDEADTLVFERDERLTARLAEVPSIESSEQAPQPQTEAQEEVRAEAQTEDVASEPMDAATRAALINSRIPRFDEPLFPDLSEKDKTGVDVFQSAIDAMDDSMTHGQGEGFGEQRASSATTSDANPDAGTAPLPAKRESMPVAEEPFDASAYIESLVHEELEINRKGSARRYSRAHLKVFEGTGDLSAISRAINAKPRHMRDVTREA